MKSRSLIAKLYKRFIRSHQIAQLKFPLTVGLRSLKTVAAGNFNVDDSVKEKGG